MGNHANINFNLLMPCIIKKNLKKNLLQLWSWFSCFSRKRPLNCPNEETSEETFFYLRKINEETFFYLTQNSYNFPKSSNIHTPPPIWLMERELYKVTTKLLASLVFLFLVGGKKRKGKMHALKKVGGINDLQVLHIALKNVCKSRVQALK